MATPDRIGPYRILRPLGKGGMGEVFLAERDDGAFQRQVALKLVHPRLDAHEIDQRFRGERQILASLDHPNIARLLGGGTTDDGHPYLVMEAIDGRPIDEYCDAEGLGIEQRIRLVLDVCSAVQAAHRSLVVHRDIKPSNILVTDDGVPKLLDFGIAKLLAPDLFPHTVNATRSGAGPMTPRYASPEQLLGRPITTASDVYSLGVLLFELLTGHSPYGPKNSKAVQAIAEDRPPDRPSAMAPKPIRRRLTGDLDRILLEALHIDVRRRYESVEQLADDLRRHLEGLPVRAQPDTFVYRTGKFLRRNRWPVTAATMFFTMAIGFSMVVALQSRAITEERDQFLVERDNALQVADFMVSVFEIDDPGEEQANALTVREVLDRSRERIETGLEGQAELQALLLEEVANSYAGLGLYGLSIGVLDDLLKTTLSNQEYDRAAQFSLTIGGYESHRGNSKEAIESLHRTLDIHRKNNLAEHHIALNAKSHLAHLYALSNQTEKSKEYIREALTTFGRMEGCQKECSSSLHTLANSQHMLGNYSDAEPLYQEALTIARRYPENVETIVKILSNLGAFYRDSGQLAQALRYLKEAQTLIQANFEPGHTYRIQGNLMLGRSYLQLARYEQSKTIFNQCIQESEVLRSKKQLNPREIFRYARCLQGIGKSQLELGEPEEAPRSLNQALEVLEPMLESDVAYFQDTRARTLLLLGRVDEARPIAEKLLDDGWVVDHFPEFCAEYGIYPPEAPENAEGTGP